MKNTNTHFESSYNSIIEFHDFLNEVSEQDTTNEADWAKWNLCDMTPAETMERAAQGGYWPEGARNIEPVTLDTEQLSAHADPVNAPQITACGYRPLVPAYLAGSPYAMISQQPQDRPDKLLKIAVNVGKKYTIGQEQTFNRGNAILSVINALNSMGYSIELWAVWHNTDHDGISIHTDIKIKDSTDFWSPDSIAFTICNDSFQRRMIWRTLDRIKNSPAMDRFDKIGMGNGLDATYEGFDIFYKYMSDHRYWDNRDSALRHIVATTQEQLSC